MKLYAEQNEFRVPYSVFELNLSAAELIYLIVLYRQKEISCSDRFRATKSQILALVRLSPSTLKNVRRRLLVRGFIHYEEYAGYLIYEILHKDGEGQNVAP